MSDIVYVSPQTYLISKDKWKSDEQKAGYIPILRADIPKFQESLQRLFKARIDQQGEGKLPRKPGSQDGQELNSSGEFLAVNGEAVTSKKYQSLKQFFPIALEQQLHTVSFQGITSKLSNDSLEEFLLRSMREVSRRLGYPDANDDLIECWTNVRFPDLQSQDVFVRFQKNDDKLYSNICRSLEVLFPHSVEKQDKTAIEFHIDSNTRMYIEDKEAEVPKIDYEELSKELNKILVALEASGTSESKNDESYGRESLDYQIDLNTLSDLPRDSLSQLCKDIIEFRTRVISIEKEKRVRDTYEEGRRRKDQMMRVFDQIRKSNNDEAIADNEQMDDSGDDEEEGDGTNEGDLLSERQRQEKEMEESTARYEEALKFLANQVEPKLVSLQRDITRQQNYEQILVNERPLYLKELLHQANDPFYDHHRSFKDAEELRDEIDRKEHGNQSVLAEEPLAVLEHQGAEQMEGDTQRLESESQKSQTHPEQVKIKIALKKAIEKSANSSSEEEEPSDTEQANREQQHEPEAERSGIKSIPDILSDADDEKLEVCLQNIKKSRLVDELVKEYLGVYEDELVEYILDNIREYRSKKALLEELKETFDEDAVTIVDKIWSNGHWVALQ